MKKIIVVSAIAASACGQYENPVSDFTIGNRLPLEIRPADQKSPPPALTPTMGNDFHPDRSYWYPSWGPYPLCAGCESVFAYVANNTGQVQRIGLAVYKHRSNGTSYLYSREYAMIEPNVNEHENNYQRIMIVNASPLNCPFSIFLTQIDVNFDPFVPNVDTDGYLIATYSGNSNMSCDN